MRVTCVSRALLCAVIATGARRRAYRRDSAAPPSRKMADACAFTCVTVGAVKPQQRRGLHAARCHDARDMIRCAFSQCCSAGVCARTLMPRAQRRGSVRVRCLFTIRAARGGGACHEVFSRVYILRCRCSHDAFTMQPEPVPACLHEGERSAPSREHDSAMRACCKDAVMRERAFTLLIFPCSHVETCISVHVILFVMSILFFLFFFFSPLPLPRDDAMYCAR